MITCAKSSNVTASPSPCWSGGPACCALKDRDLWIGWSANQRIERLKLGVQNRRFLLLTRKGQSPNLASQALAAVLRVLPEHWHQHFGYRPLLAETFTDPEAYAGTCYKASNWEPVGFSAGYRRHRADFYVLNERPKKLWLYPLGPNAKALLWAVQVPEGCRAGLGAAPSGTSPVAAADLDSLLDVFRHAPDPRDDNTRYRIGPVLTLVAMALLAGRREIAEIARFATTLTQAQHRRLGLPRKRATRRFYQVPGSSAFYQVLTRMDSEAFATLLNGLLQARAGRLPAALALDGNMIRDHIGLLTLAQHEYGAPQAVAIYNQKEHTPRCEQTAAAALLKQLPALDDKLITGDPLHCQRAHARTIVEKGGEYLFRNALLPVQRTRPRPDAGALAGVDSGTLGRGGNPQPLAARCGAGRRRFALPERHPAGQSGAAPRCALVRAGAGIGAPIPAGGAGASPLPSRPCSGPPRLRLNSKRKTMPRGATMNLSPYPWAPP